MPRQYGRKLAVAERRSRVADLYVRGWTQTAISQKLEMAQSTISADLKSIQKEWRENAVRDFDAAREKELQKLGLLEREAWAAWERSQKQKQSARIRVEGDQQKTEKLVADQAGDPRFLDQIHKCIVSRRALLGLDAPTEIVTPEIVTPEIVTPEEFRVAGKTPEQVRAEVLNTIAGLLPSPDKQDCKETL